DAGLGAGERDVLGEAHTVRILEAVHRGVGVERPAVVGQGHRDVQYQLLDGYSRKPSEPGGARRPRGPGGHGHRRARPRRTPPATVGEHLAALAAASPFPPGPHLVAGPLHHTGPLSAVRHALAGGTVVILERFDPEAALAAIERHRVESSVMVPTHFSRFLA